MRRITAVALALALNSAAAVIGGCGGNAGGVGGVVIQMDWPAERAAQGGGQQVWLEARFLDTQQRWNRDLGIQWLNQPATGLTFYPVPAGQHLVQLSQYADPIAQGNLLGRATVPVTVAGGSDTFVPVTIGGMVNSLHLWPGLLRMRDGQTRKLVTTFRAADGKVLVTKPDIPVEFEVIQGRPYITVDPEGEVIPTLGDVPYLKGLLRACHRDKCAETIVIVTPRVVR